MRRTQTDTRQREGARRADSHLRLAKLQAAASEWRLVERRTTSANRHAPRRRGLALAKKRKALTGPGWDVRLMTALQVLQVLQVETPPRAL